MSGHPPVNPRSTTAGSLVNMDTHFKPIQLPDLEPPDPGGTNPSLRHVTHQFGMRTSGKSQHHTEPLNWKLSRKKMYFN